MRNLIVTLAALLGTSMLAGAAMADGGAGICKLLERIQDRCGRHGGSCDRIDEAVDQLCVRDTIVASRSADSAALDLLRQDYEIVALEDAVFPYDHVVVGPDDLDDPEVVDLLREAQGAGKTVAITDVTEDQVQSFHGLIFAGQAADCVSPDDPSQTIELYGLQQSSNPPRTGSYCLDSLDQRDPASDRRWLRERFGAQVPGQLTPVPLFDASASRADLADPAVVLARLVREWLGGRPAQAQTSSASTQQLSSLATAKTCSYKATDDSVGSTEQNLTVYSARSFAQETDYYLVNFAPILTPLVADITEYVLNSLTLMELDGSDSDFIDLANGDIIDPNPQTVTSFVSSYTTGSSTTVSGSIGFDGEAATGSVGESTTVGSSTTYDTPEVTILNQVDTNTLAPNWTFKPQSTIANTTFDPIASWIWQLPKNAYPLGGTGSNQLSFTPGANLFTSTANSTFVATCNVTVPFTTWTILAPVLTSVSPTSQAIGETVTVDGQYLYDGLTEVLLGGTEVPTANLDINSTTSFTLTVPGDTSIGPNAISAETKYSGSQGSQTLDSATSLNLDVTSD